MGSIKFPHTSGNSMSIAAPATNPASDLELKLPATVGTAGQVLKNSSTPGTLEFGDDSAGKILQVVQSVKNNESSISGTTYTDIPGTDETGAGSIWEVNITPTKANSKILFELSAAMGGNLGVMMTLRLVREIQDANAATPFLGHESGSMVRASRQIRDDQTAMKVHAIHQSHFSYLDSPSYTLGNKITYHVEGVGYSATANVFINRSGSKQSESTYDAMQASTLTVMEIAA